MRTFMTLLLMLAASSVHAGTIRVTGNWSLIHGTDTVGFDGMIFDLRVTPGAPSSLYTFPSGSESTTLSLGTRELLLPDGFQSHDLVRQNSSVLDATTVDRIGLGGSAFYYDGLRIEVPSITLHFDGDLITAPGIDPLPAFDPTDINHITLGSWAGSHGLQVWTDTSRLGRYTIDNLAVTPLPGPGGLWLLAMGLAGAAISRSGRW